MIIHTVAFQTQHPKGSAAEKDFLQAGIALGKLPGVENFQCFRQISPKNDFEFGFSMEFATQAEYDAYTRHPEHVNFVETRWKPEVKTFMEIDYVSYETD